MRKSTSHCDSLPTYMSNSQDDVRMPNHFRLMSCSPNEDFPRSNGAFRMRFRGKHFSTIRSPNLELTPLKSASKTRSEMFVRHKMVIACRCVIRDTIRLMIRDHKMMIAWRCVTVTVSVDVKDDSMTMYLSNSQDDSMSMCLSNSNRPTRTHKMIACRGVC
jgi:hypothetical protein